ncbi:deoxynucleotide monophosphate kinase protein [Rhizobium phage RHEph21]|uniref:Deoxynucleotide monophosphate kinase protein n=2 Tax=root TaxID=1 RepID=A0AAE7VN40_9CAUD|nr:deoxynucleotide monophosphate kinase protein [Rhizobium phage RHEph21]
MATTVDGKVLRCTGCGSTMNEDELREKRKTNPKLIACCPERSMKWQPKGKLVALYSDAAGSGKSEVAKVLMSQGYVNVKFAGPLKDMARGLLGSMGFDPEMVERQIEGDLKEQVIPGFMTVTPRQIMQTLGTDWGREAIDQDLWTKVARAKIEKLRDQGINVVVDDLRFPNEYDLIRGLGGFAVNVIRPDPTREAGGAYEGKLRGYQWHHKLYNTGSLYDLRGKVLSFASYIQDV